MPKPFEQELADNLAYIKAQARLMARRPDDIEEFIQEGCIAVWEASQEKHWTLAYVRQKIKWRMQNYANRVLYNNPEEQSANDMFGGLLWGEFSEPD